MEDGPREFNERTKTLSCSLFVIFSAVEWYIFFSLKNHTYFYIVLAIFLVSILLVIFFSETGNEKD